MTEPAMKARADEDAPPYYVTQQGRCNAELEYSFTPVPCPHCGRTMQIDDLKFDFSDSNPDTFVRMIFVCDHGGSEEKT